jgi:hypothetical protein
MNIKDIAPFLIGARPGNIITTDDEMTWSDGFKLWFREGGYGNEGRIAISFSRPRDAKGQYLTLWAKVGSGTVHDPRITVANTKSPEKIANDIKRRILPEAEVVFKLAKERIAAEDNFHTGKDKTIHLMAALCGTEPERHYQSKELTGEIDPYKGAGVPSFKEHGYGKIKVTGPDSVTIELTSIGVDTASALVSEISRILTNIGKKTS